MKPESVTRTLLIEACHETSHALSSFMELEDNVKLGDVQKIRDRLSRAASKLTMAMSIIAGNPEPKTGEAQE